MWAEGRRGQKHRVIQCLDLCTSSLPKLLRLFEFATVTGLKAADIAAWCIWDQPCFLRKDDVIVEGIYWQGKGQDLVTGVGNSDF